MEKQASESIWSGLPVAQQAQVLAILVELVRRQLAASEEGQSDEHPASQHSS